MCSVRAYSVMLRIHGGTDVRTVQYLNCSRMPCANKLRSFRARFVIARQFNGKQWRVHSVAQSPALAPLWVADLNWTGLYWNLHSLHICS